MSRHLHFSSIVQDNVKSLKWWTEVMARMYLSVHNGQMNIHIARLGTAQSFENVRCIPARIQNSLIIAYSGKQFIWVIAIVDAFRLYIFKKPLIFGDNNYGRKSRELSLIRCLLWPARMPSHSQEFNLNVCVCVFMRFYYNLRLGETFRHENAAWSTCMHVSVRMHLRAPPSKLRQFTGRLSIWLLKFAQSLLKPNDSMD